MTGCCATDFRRCFKIDKIGIYGGTFNPPHIGHLLLAEGAAETLKLEKVIFMPGGTPPHKENDKVLDKYHRYKMTKLLAKDNPRFEVCDYEIKKDTASYTAETLTEIKKAYPKSRLYFIIGLDSLYDMEGWYKPDVIFKNAAIAVALREGYDFNSVCDVVESYEKKYGAEIIKTDMPLVGISSSDIRHRIKNGKSIRYMTTAAVEEYIRKNGLYKNE